MKTILFPTDFSKNAEHASQYAGMLARSMNARIVILNVHAPFFTKSQNKLELCREIAKSRKEAEEDLKKFTSIFIEKTLLSPNRIIQCVEFGSSVSEKIVEKATQINAHFIVMGTKGASNILTKWLGTNAQKVMKMSESPVWIIPDNIPITFPHKVMYAADFKEDEFLATVKLTQILEPLVVRSKVIHIHDFLEMNLRMKTFLSEILIEPILLKVWSPTSTFISPMYFRWLFMKNLFLKKYLKPASPNILYNKQNCHY
jgi:nucleotide-binding universal stress UspA family protein